MKFLVVFAILAAVAAAEPKVNENDRIFNIIAGILDIFKPKEPISVGPAIVPPYEEPEHPIVVEEPVYDRPEHPIVVEGPVVPGPALPPVVTDPNPAPVAPPTIPFTSPLVKVVMNIN